MSYINQFTKYVKGDYYRAMAALLTDDTLSSIPHLRHAFFTRSYGNGGFSGQGKEGDVHENRAAMAKHLQVEPQNLLSCYQIHSPDVVTVSERWDEARRPKADAMVTDKMGIAIGILTADCVPVLFASSNAPVIGAAHAGWRGALTGVLENTLAAMEKLGAQRQTISAALGPCIWQDSYEVGPEFPAPFLAEDPDNERFFRPAFKSGHFMFNLPAYVEHKLKKLGIEKIASSPADTCAAPDKFFSHRYSTLRQEKRDGNLMSAIAMVAS